MTRYFLFIGPLNHLAYFKKHGYVQQNYNHKKRLSKLSKGDYVIFYASRTSSTSSEPYRKIIAVGRVTNSKIYTVKVGNKKFHRMKVKFMKTNEIPLTKKIIQKLKFIKNKKYYGLYFISGFRELSKSDFNIMRNK
jgi:predicted RNA-binding protein